MTFNRGQSVSVQMPNGKFYPGFIKSIPGDNYTRDGETEVLKDKYWVKYWDEPKPSLGAGYPKPVKCYATCVVKAERLKAR